MKISLQLPFYVKLKKNLETLLQYDKIATLNLHISSDGYISVNDILSLNLFRNYTFEDIYFIVISDEDNQFLMKENEHGNLYIKYNELTKDIH